MNEEQGYYISKKSGQIPAFGNWEYANDLPITQYFESARQAGLFRYSNSSGECAADLYALNFNKPPQNQKTRGNGGGNYKGCPHPHVKDQKKNQVKTTKKQVGEFTEPPRKQQQHHPNHGQKTASNKIPRRQQTRTTTTTTTPVVAVRAVDEDLYKIPPHLLHSSKRKRRLGFFSRCLVPACMG